MDKYLAETLNPEVERVSIDSLKWEARKDMGNGELGFAEGVVDGKIVVVTCRLVGANQPGRTVHSRYKVTYK